VFWASAPFYPAIDDLDRCCREHDSCLGRVKWDPGAGAWVPDPTAPSPCNCDRNLCSCARLTITGGGMRRRVARMGIICLFCSRFAPHCP
jgi:hypothetical protein